MQNATITWNFLPKLPDPGQINGYWAPVPVIVATKDGRVHGRYFTFIGGDGLEPAETPIPAFTTDEGLDLPLEDIEAWSYMPYHPTKRTNSNDP